LTVFIIASKKGFVEDPLKDILFSFFHGSGTEYPDDNLTLTKLNGKSIPHSIAETILLIIAL